MLHSGIAPLDLLGGMIPHRLHLLTGGPGTGKSTACYHFLQSGLSSGEAAVLLSADHLSDLHSHAHSLGLQLAPHLRSGQLGLLRFRPDFERHLSSSASPYRVMDDLWHLIVQIKPARLVIDPLSPFLTDSTASGAALAALAQLLDGFGVTTLLTCPIDVSARYDARLSAIVQRAAMIVHLERDDGPMLRLQVLQDRTQPVAGGPVRYQLLPETGMTACDAPHEHRTTAVLPAYLEIARSS